MNEMQTSTPLTEIAATLRHAERVLALSHVSPDGDAIGALLGFGWLMCGRPGFADAGRATECGITLACADGVPAPYRFLPGATEIVSDPPDGPWDVVVTLDASDPQRLGDIYHPATVATATVATATVALRSSTWTITSPTCGSAT